MQQNASGNSFFQSCKVIFGITIMQTMRSKKTIFIMIATFLPVLFAVYHRVAARGTPIDSVHVLSLIMPFFLQFLSALVALFYATALIADEVDGKTITYLFTRPIKKYSIIVGKFSAYMLEASIILVPPMLLTYLIIAAGNGISTEPILSLGHFGKQLGVTMLALAAYGAIFTFFGAWWRRPVVLGLLFAFGWEKVAIIVPGIIKKFSVIHYLMSIFPKGKVMKQFRMHMPPEVVSDSSALVSIIVLLAIIGVFLGLAIFTIYRKEYRFE